MADLVSALVQVQCGVSWKAKLVDVCPDGERTTTSRLRGAVTSLSVERFSGSSEFGVQRISLILSFRTLCRSYGTKRFTLFWLGSLATFGGNKILRRR
jgi:hypothetical protein